MQDEGVGDLIRKERKSAGKGHQQKGERPELVVSHLTSPVEIVVVTRVWKGISNLCAKNDPLVMLAGRTKAVFLVSQDLGGFVKV